MLALSIIVKIAELIFWVLLSAVATTAIMFLLFLYCRISGVDIHNKRH